MIEDRFLIHRSFPLFLLVLVLVLDLDMISLENEDDDENEGGGRWVPLLSCSCSFSCSSAPPLWRHAGFIVDNDLGSATAEASAPVRPVPMLPPVTTAILPAKLN